ncbi:MAG: malonyl-CoA decarboxylase [Stellaceae bacterium]
MSERIGFLDGVVDRTLDNLRSLRLAWRDIAVSTRSGASPRPELPRDDVERLRQRLKDCLEGRGGEVAARARSADLGRIYLALNDTGRERFLSVLASEFDIDRGTVDALCRRLIESGRDERQALEQQLREALEPPRVKLLTHFNALPEGVKFLVDLRAELMALARTDKGLAGLEGDLKNLLASWFDIGFLELQRITWNSPAALLERLARYEAVHRVRNWADMKNRLDPDRRCFAYFHPRMPEEPLIFVEVALVKGMAANVRTLLDMSAPLGDPDTADTAIFYSISNCQRGLSGISLGDFLIKRVAERLHTELPHLKTFATLSPIPGFRAWLDKEMTKDEDILLPGEHQELPAALAGEKLSGLLARPRWQEEPELVQALKAPLLRLCARYLYLAKRPSGTVADSVAHFHLANGARMEQLNWLADNSANGLKQSCGIMINYLYRLNEIEENHEAYVGERLVAASTAIQRLAKA